MTMYRLELKSILAVCCIALVPGFSLAGANEELLTAAEKSGPKELAKALARGANVNAQDTDGWTALLFASSAGHLEQVQKLLASGADPSISSKKGETPLVGAVVSGNPAIVRALLSAGASASAKMPNGRTAIDVAVDRKLDTIVRMLRVSAAVEAAAGPTPSPIAVPVVAQAAAASAPVAVAAANMAADSNVQGLSSAVIKAFLIERAEIDEAKAKQHVADAARKKSEIDAADGLHKKFDVCVSNRNNCIQQCDSASNTNMVAGALTSLLGGGGKTGADIAIINGGAAGMTCEASCRQSNCEAILQ